MVRVADYIFDFLARQGVDHVSFLPGGGCMHLVDALGADRRIAHTCFLHEQAAAIAAEAYAQYRNDLAVCLVTAGPGGTNAITGVASAWIDSVPLLVLSGQVKRADLMAGSGLRQRGVQEVDIVSLVTPITKYAVTVMEPDSIRRHLEEAVRVALSGRPGPVWLDIPLDIQGAQIDPATLRGIPPARTADMNPGAFVPAVVELLEHSERPVFLAGNGIRLAGAREAFLDLALKLGIPVLTTWRALDLVPEDHVLYCGRPGSIAQRGANFVQQNADLLIAIGARLDLAQVAFNYENFARRAKKIVVDLDAAELAKLKTTVDVAIQSDAGAFIRALGEAPAGQRDRRPWVDRCREWKAKYPVVDPAYREEKKHVNTYVLVDALSDLLGPRDVVVPGSSGACSEMTLQAFRVKQGQRVLNSPGLGAMGFGLPAAIGACLASGRRRTVAIIGDGGLQHNIQELQTVARLGLPIKFFILNNDGYASIRSTQTRYFDGRLVGCDPSSGLTLPDTRRVAAAYGLETARLENHDGLDDRVRAILDAPGPVVCEVLVAPDLATAPRVTSRVQPDGSMVSAPMEDLWPLLDRDELAANLIAGSRDPRSGADEAL